MVWWSTPVLREPPESGTMIAMNVSPVAKGIIQNVCTTVTIVGFCLLGLVIFDYTEGALGPEYFPDVELVDKHHLYGLLLALPVPLHVIFIGLIIQKQWLSVNMARFAWVGISSSGIWLGIALAVRFFFL